MKLILYLLTTTLFLISSQHHAFCQNFEWMKSFGGSDHENLHDATLDSSGNIYISGAFAGTIDVDPGEGTYFLTSKGSMDTYVVKLNADGEFIHAHTIGADGPDYARVIAVDDEFNYYVSGTFEDKVDIDPGPDTLIFEAVNDYDIYFQKFNENGILQWAFQLETYYNDDDELEHITIDKEGNIYCVGGFYNTIDFDPGTAEHELTSNGRNDVFILKLNRNGNFLWAKNIGSWYEDYATRLLINSLGELIVTGSFKGVVDFDPSEEVFELASSGSYNVFFLNLTPDGEFNWVKQIAASYISTAKIDSKDNIIGAGSFRFSTDFDPDPEETFIVEGGVMSDMYILKLDAEGNFIWVKTLGNESATFVHTIDLDTADNIYFASNFKSPIDIIPGDSIYLVEPLGDDDFFIEKLSHSGEFISAIVIGSPYLDYIKTVAIDEKNHIVTVGIFDGNPEYSLDSTSASVSTAGSVDVFIQKIIQKSDSVDYSSVLEFPALNLSLYPNPNSGHFFIKSNDLRNGIYKLRIIDCFGKTVFEKNIKNMGVLPEEINLDQKGVFFLEISLGVHSRTVKKIIVN